MSKQPSTSKETKPVGTKMTTATKPTYSTGKKGTTKKTFID